MTQTLTTKVLNDFITGQGYGVAPSAVVLMARELLANREAQPVALIDRRPGPSRVVWRNGGDQLPHGTELYTAPPAPVVNPELTRAPEVPGAIITAPVEAMRCGPAASYVMGWNACRATMLAQPVCQRYKLVPAEPTEAMLLVLGMTGSFESMTEKYRKMLAAEPEGGN